MNKHLLCSLLLLSLTSNIAQCMQEETDEHKESHYLFVVENQHTANTLAKLTAQYKSVQRDTPPDLFLRNKISKPCFCNGMCHDLNKEAYALFQSMHKLQENTQATIDPIPVISSTGCYGWGFHFKLQEPVAPEQFRKIKDSLWVARLLEGESVVDDYIKDKDARPFIALKFVLVAALSQYLQNQQHSSAEYM